MTNAHDDDYSELLTATAGISKRLCRRTVAQQPTGRSDWETVTRFLPWLQSPATWAEVNSRAAMLPLAVPQISIVEPWPRSRLHLCPPKTLTCATARPAN
ncbi:MAG: hypothetical protein R3A10_19270 [Caldilineaceae bacterium]